MGVQVSPETTHEPHDYGGVIKDVGDQHQQQSMLNPEKRGIQAQYGPQPAIQMSPGTKERGKGCSHNHGR